jgi:hypothetical protein
MGGEYHSVLSNALINDIFRNTFFSGNIGKITRNITKAYPQINVNDFEKAFKKTYIVNYNDNLFIVSCGKDNMKSFTGRFGLPTNVSFIEYFFNIKDIVLAKEYYGTDSYLRSSPKVFIYRKNDTIQYFNHLTYLLARERFERFPKGYDFKKFYRMEYERYGYFISYDLKEDSWKVLWGLNTINDSYNQDINDNIEDFISILKFDSIFRSVDSIHFPFYLPNLEE